MPGIDANTVLMLHMDGADASTTFTDSSSGAKTVTANGNAQIDTATSKFGGASGLLDGTGDYLTLADSDDWDWGTGAFTVDFWFKYNSLAANYQTQFMSTGWAAGLNISLNRPVGPSAEIYVIGNQYNYTYTADTTTWHHCAVVRNGDTLSVYIDGTALDAGQSIAGKDLTGLTGGLSIGSGTGYADFNGWLDEMRVSKGIARWTANFTPATEAYSGASAKIMRMCLMGIG
jgi:hypothetical protein